MNRNKIVYDKWTFEGNDFKDGNMFLAMSFLSSQLQANTFEATVKSSDKTILNFERNTKMIYYYNNAQRGIFYIQDIERTGADTYHITATSVLGLLIEGIHYGGIYTGQTSQEIVSSICGNVPFIIKSNLVDTKMYGWLPVASPRDNLSQVLFALGAVLKTDLDGVLRIERLWNGISSSVPKSRMYDGSKVEYSAKVTQVSVTEHQYYEGNETKKLFEGTAKQGDIITFSAPMHSLSATNITILESGANWAKLSAGSGTLTGKEYIHNTRIITKNVLSSNTPNVKTVEKATLVSLVNSQAVAERLAAYYKCQEIINAPVVYHGENTGDCISSYHPFDKETVRSCLQSADITLSNTLKSQEKSLVGFAPLKPEDVVVYSHSEILTGSGEWNPPAGVTEAMVVVIGGGCAGNNGQSGSTISMEQHSERDSKTISFSSTSSTQNFSGNYSWNTTGNSDGGKGGKGGLPGRVFQTNTSIASGVKVPYSCGVGGASNGALGTESTFGSISSAQGSRPEYGYIDTITGKRFAAPGANGEDGGNGGGSNSDGQSKSLSFGGKGCASKSFSDNVTTTGNSGSNSFRLNATGSGFVNGAGGGGAGGSSGSKKGENGGDWSITVQEEDQFEVYATTYYAVGVKIIPFNGGKGGNGADGENGQTYGSGGNGGGGGGGGGQVSTCNANFNATITRTAGTGNFSGYASWVLTNNSTWNASGGNGGNGGSGANGCIILYYNIIEEIKSGQFLDKNGKRFLDKIVRRFIV